MHSTYFLETERLYFRKFTPDDLPLIEQLDMDSDVMEHIGPIKNREECEAYLQKIISYYDKKGGLGYWALFQKAPHQYIGWAALKDLDGTSAVEVGYRLKTKAWGKGFATEAASRLLEYGFEQLGLHEIVAVTIPENIASRKVIDKLGLKADGAGFFYHTQVLVFKKASPKSS